MGLLKRYDKSVVNNVGLASEDPVKTSPGLTVPLKSQFDKTNFDLENPQPLGGPINEPFQTIIGNEVKFFNTTQPFTPQNTYKDNLQSAELRARASDPIR